MSTANHLTAICLLRSNVDKVKVTVDRSQESGSESEILYSSNSSYLDLKDFSDLVSDHGLGVPTTKLLMS